MRETINKLLVMAEMLDSRGFHDVAKECRDTAKHVLAALKHTSDGRARK
jgi:hypothetical protein